MKCLFVLILCFAFCCPFFVIAIKNESSSSTQNPGFFGYFGNFWKKQAPSSSCSTNSTSEAPAGIFGSVRNWMNVMKDKLPLKMQKTSSPKISTKHIRKIHSTARTKSHIAVSLNILNTSTRTIKRRADTEILGIAESSPTFTKSSDSISPETNCYYSSYEFVLGQFQKTVTPVKQIIMNISSPVISATNDTFTKLSTATISSSAMSNSSASAIESNIKLDPFVHLEKFNNGDNNLSLNANEYELINRNDYNSVTPTQSAMRKLFEGNKLIPSYISFYNADDLSGNGSKIKVPSPLTTFSNLNTRIRIRQSKSKKLRKMPATKSRSTSKSTTTGSSDDSILD